MFEKNLARVNLKYLIFFEKFRNGTEKIFEDYFLEFENDKLFGFTSQSSKI